MLARRRPIHPLDHPIWNSLHSGWSALAEGGERALRLEQRHGPFAATATADPEAMAALLPLIPHDGELWLLGQDARAILPAGARLARTATLAQMMATRPAPADPGAVDWVVLGEADAAEMLDLALLTKPGPFRPLTHRLGRFIGVREDGRLIAMAGERMRMPGFAEVSGVCTHPDWRGRRLAGHLMRIVMQAMVERGDTPFLHAYADHDRTIALYRTLGFEVRAALPMAVVTR
jgi:predicted GNAT family acetyltransferase